MGADQHVHTTRVRLFVMHITKPEIEIIIASRRILSEALEILVKQYLLEKENEKDSSNDPYVAAIRKLG